MPYAKYLSTERAAEELGLSPWTLIKWRRVGKGPPFVRFGRSVKYQMADLAAFIAVSRVEPGQ